MSENRCPYCGAELRAKSHSQFECWSINHGPEEDRRSDDCRISELEQRNAKLEAVVSAARQTRDTWEKTNRYIKGIQAINITLNALDKEDGDDG